MPIYTFKHKKTQEIREEIMSWSDREEFLKKNKQWEPTLTTASFADPVRMGRVKTPQSFRDTLKYIKQRNPKSTINSD